MWHVICDDLPALREAIKVNQTQFHVVQELAPGGIECLALGLAEKSEGTVGLISLSGTVDDLVTHWQALLPLRSEERRVGKEC